MYSNIELFTYLGIFGNVGSRVASVLTKPQSQKILEQEKSTVFRPTSITQYTIVVLVVITRL